MAGICIVSSINTLKADEDTHEVFFLCDESMSQEVLKITMDRIIKALNRGPLPNSATYLAKPEHSPVHSYIQ